MSTDRERDADLDRLLRTTLRRQPAEAPGACPDAGMLAAFLEGGVAADERAALEGHVASCGRCQDVLAAMDLETPASPAVPARRPWLWRGHLHWLIPVGAAAALVVYVASRPAIAPGVPEGVRPEGQVAENRAAATVSEERPAAREQAAVPIARQAERAPVFEPKPAPSQPAPAPSAREGRRADAAVAERIAPDADASNRAAKQASDTKTELAQRPASTMAEAVSGARPAAAPVPPAEQAPQAVPSKGEGALAAVDRANRAVAGDLIVLSAPGGQIQWRIGAEGAIWRSADEGRSWYPQKSGVKVALLAASAPSISTCWAVGAGGTVLLTDDGERWERRPFPETIDLVAVDARSAHDASVTTRDGRRFVTADRGATWTLQRQLP